MRSGPTTPSSGRSQEKRDEPEADGEAGPMLGADRRARTGLTPARPAATARRAIRAALGGATLTGEHVGPQLDVGFLVVD